MNAQLFRIWLPISLGIHIVLLPLMYFIPMSVAAPAQTEYRVVRVEEPVAPMPEAPVPKPPAPRPRPVPKPAAPKPKPKPAIAAPQAPAKAKPQPVPRVMPQPVVPAPTATPATPAPALANTTPGSPSRPPEIAQWGELKHAPAPSTPGALAPGRQLAQHAGPLQAPPLSAGNPGGSGVPSAALSGVIGSVATSSRNNYQLPVAAVQGTPRAGFGPQGLGNGPVGPRPGVPGVEGDATPAVPNLSRVTTPVPGMSAPGASPAPVFRPGVPGGSIASNGGSPFIPALNDPTVPPGIAEGARDGRAPILADPRLPVGTSSGIGQGPGTGPARPAHGPISVGGPQVAYPRLAAKEGNSGTVIIAVNVSPDGVPLSAAIEKRSEADALDNTALAAAKKWTFRPAEDGHGKTVASKARLEFRFEVGKEPEVQQL